MSELVLLEKGEPVTTTLIIADEMGLKHLALLQLVKKYKSRLEKKGTLKSQILKSKGRPTTFYFLNEQQTSFLVTLMRNSEIVVDFKDKINEEFYKMKNFILNLHDEERRVIRERGKISRKEETDTIKRFVNYAVKQGSNNAEKYYIHISKMENKAFFFIEQKFKNIRDVMIGSQLSTIEFADKVVEKALNDGMDMMLHYKEIYQLAKDRIQQGASIIEKTHIPFTQTHQIN